MAGVDFGTQELGVGVNASIDMQRLQAQKEAQSQGQAVQAGAPAQAAVSGLTQQALGKIKVDKQMAEGLGDPALEGTSWDPKMLAAVAKIKGASDYHKSLVEAGIIKEDKKDDTAKTVADTKAKAETDSATIKANATKDAAKTNADAKVKAAATPKPAKPAKEDTPEQKKEKAAKLLDGISKAKDDASKKTAIANYNSVAKDVGLAPYEEEPGFIDKVKGALGFGKSGGVDDAKTAKAKKILQDAGKPVTDANVKHVADQLDDSGN